MDVGAAWPTQGGLLPHLPSPIPIPSSCPAALSSSAQPALRRADLEPTCSSPSPSPPTPSSPTPPALLQYPCHQLTDGHRPFPLHFFMGGGGVRGGPLRKRQEQKRAETQGRDGAISQGELSFISRATSDNQSMTRRTSYSYIIKA